MGTDEVEISGIGMLLSVWRDAGRDGRPVQSQASHMCGFDATPEAKPLHPIFKLGMIASDDHKDREKGDERAISELVPPLLKQRDRGGGSGQEDGEPPSCKSRAGLS